MTNLSFLRLMDCGNTWQIKRQLRSSIITHELYVFIFKCIWFVFYFLSLWRSLFSMFVFLKHQGAARRLLKTALNVAAKKRQLRYDDLKKIEKGVRRFFHDDITVVVIFIDNELSRQKISVPELSVRGFIDTVGPSNFNILQNWCQLYWVIKVSMSIWCFCNTPIVVSFQCFFILNLSLSTALQPKIYDPDCLIILICTLWR